MVIPYFSSIRETLVKALGQAEESIDIAVAWFTNEQLFDVVTSRLDGGVKVRMVLVNDDINHCGGLDFQRFVDKGGRLFFGKTGYFMHNKYCIIDGRTVYTGSYNYTYYAEHSNFENIVRIDGEESAVSEYVKNYGQILSVSDEATNIEAFLKVHPYSVNTHASRQMRNRDLYQKANELYERKDAARAEEVITSLNSSSVQEMDSFVIRDVLYKQWQPGFCIRQITVTDSEVTLSIEVDASSRGLFLFGPGLNKTWHLRSSTDVVSASSIKDVKLDGTSLLDKLEANTSYHYEEAGTSWYIQPSSWGRAMDGSPLIKDVRTKPDKGKTLTCSISFPKGDYINEIVDVYEGDVNDINDKDFWHFLRVNMLLNREAL